jgi:hypothetical protein
LKNPLLKSCGITNAVNGTEDDQIHCFKSDGPIPSGRALLTNCREKKDDAELQLFLQDVENETEMNDGEIAYDSDNSIEIEC